MERTPAELDTILSTVMFTDIVDSTHKQASLGDHGWKQLIERHHVLVREALERWRGVEIDTAGDGFYASFDGPARAIRCALDVCRRVSRSRDRDPCGHPHGRSGGRSNDSRIRGRHAEDRVALRGAGRSPPRSSRLADGEAITRRLAPPPHVRADPR